MPRQNQRCVEGEKMKRKLVRTTINLYSDQLGWLKSHPEFNLSGWVRKEIDKLMEDEKNEVENSP